MIFSTFSFVLLSSRQFFFWGGGGEGGALVYPLKVDFEHVLFLCFSPPGSWWCTGRDVVQLIVRSGVLLMQIWLPGAARDFFPRVMCMILMDVAGSRWHEGQGLLCLSSSTHRQLVFSCRQGTKAFEVQLNFVFCCILQKQCIIHLGLHQSLGSRSHWRVKKNSVTCCMWLQVVLRCGSGTVRVALDGQGKQWCMYASSMSSPRVLAGSRSPAELGRGGRERASENALCGWLAFLTGSLRWRHSNTNLLLGVARSRSPGQLQAIKRQRKVSASGIAWFAARASRVQIPGYKLEIV